MGGEDGRFRMQNLSFLKNTRVVRHLAGWGLAAMALAFFLNSAQGDGAPATAKEVPVCGIFGMEARAFQGWRAMAQRSPTARDVPGYDYEQIILETSDARSLNGYRIGAKQRGSDRRALLFLQGNAVLADQLRNDLTFFADRGFDVFTFDYRGYGNSSGRPFLNPIGEDQAEVAAYLRGLGYDQMFLYGISMGGIFGLSPHMPLEVFDAIAVDATPATFPWFAICPGKYNPISNLPKDASNIMVISGGRDGVVPRADVAPLGREVAARGGIYRHEPGFGHPLMDSARNTRARFTIVADFFDDVE